METQEEIQTPKTRKGRVVAIVGRPNVGKSALFNRIAGRRIAIVHDESGVTRDRLMLEVSWNNNRFHLIDTGGIMLSSQPSSFGQEIRDQVAAALQDASVAVLVVDVQTGIQPLDEEVADMLRKADVPLLLAVNKCDLPSHEANALEFSKLGLPTFNISAAHGSGIGALMDAVLPYLPEEVNQTVVQPLRVAVVGRPNAGKSSYINRLLDGERLIVSNIAGTTRDSIEVPFAIGEGPQARHYVFVDTAGMRNRHKCDSAVERFSLFRAEESVKKADIVVLVMESEIGPTVQDKRIARLISDNNKGCVVLMNKWDLAIAKGIAQKKAEEVIRTMMPFLSYCPLVFTSTKSGQNVRKSIEVIDHVAAQTRMKLPTGMLNRTIEEATKRAVVPMRFGKRLRIYYALQVCVAPVTIRMFVNDPKLMTQNYLEFLRRSIRERFGLEGAPVVIFLKARPRPEKMPRRRRAKDGSDDV